MLPKHIGIIMDGNGRWAQGRNLDRLDGHRKGAQVGKDVAKTCCDLGIRYLTLYAFSEENWGRPKNEVSGLMLLLKSFLTDQLPLMMKEGIRLRTIGNIEKLPLLQQKVLDHTMWMTRKNDKLDLIVALSYGGRDEITRAVQKIAKAVEQKTLSAKEITPELISSHLDTAEFPDPELIVRTSGEFRTSNFLPWQSTYSEYFVTSTLWPDFTPQELKQIIERFSTRERRFGKTSEQVKEVNV